MENDKQSLIRDFNAKASGAHFGDIITGKVSFNNLSDEQKADLARIFSSHPGKYDDFVRQATEAFEQRQNTTSVPGAPKNAFLALRHINMEAENIQNSLVQLRAFMETKPMPGLAQNAAYGHLFTPLQQNANGTLLFSDHAQTQRLIAQYAGIKNSPSSRAPMDIAIANEIMNSRMLRGFNGGEIRFQGGNIWSQLDSPASTNAYSNFSVNAQNYLEKFATFQQRLGNPKSSANAFIALDIETFGDNATGDWFHINEIAAQKFRFDRKEGKHVEGEAFSWLTKPTRKLHGDMVSTIEALKQNPLAFVRLSEARQRSLVDLMRYSTASTVIGNQAINPAQFERMGENLNVVHSNALDLNNLYGGKTLNQKVIMENFNSYADHMLSGLSNLGKNGEDAREVMGRYNELLHKNKANFFITHNGDAFDIPGLQKFGEAIGVPTGKPLHHLDWMKLEQSVFANPFVMHQVYGRGKDVPYEEGPWTNQEHRRTFGWDTSKGHIGAYDVGKYGTGGIVLSTMDAIANQISSAGKSELDTTGLRRDSAILAYNETPVHKGQSFFAVNAVQNRNRKFADFQGEYINGQLEVINPEFNQNVLDAESFYTALGVRKLEGERYALELLNEATGVYSYIIREGENARDQIAQFVQQHLKTADDMMDEGKAGIFDANLTDKARRRYDSLFGLNQGYTKGFDAAKRIFENVGIYNELAETMSQTEIEKRMNFNSLANGAFNATEAEQFWKMLPRLQSEYGAYSAAIQEIEQAIPMTGNNVWEQRNINMQRSLALRRFGNELNEATGGLPTETRPALPYERHVLEFNDRITGSSRSLNLKDMSSAYQGIQSYVYGSHRQYEGDPKKQAQAATERYLTLITSLQETQVTKDGKSYNLFTREQLSDMVDDFFKEGQNPSIHAKTLAMELSTNLDILDLIERDSITSTSLGARKAVENLNTAEISSMAQRATAFALDVQGFRDVRGHMVSPTMTNEMARLFDQLDQTHNLTGLTPNHRQAIGGMLQRFMSAGKLSHNVGMAVTVGMDNNMAYLNLFDEKHTTSVLSQLEGAQAHPQAVRIPIPLIGKNGTMRYNNMQINANSTLIMGAGGVEKISSVQKLTGAFGNSEVQEILSALKEGDMDTAQWKANLTVKDAVDDLAGIKRNIGGGENDTYLYKDTLADAYKQGHINVVPAMAHDLYQSGELEQKHFKDTAFDGGQLKTYLTDKDLESSGMEIIDRKKLEWASQFEDLIGPVDMSSVKSDHAAGVVGTVFARYATPFGAATPHGRDNSVQVANSYAFDQELQESFGKIKDGTYISFDTLTQTPLGQALEQRLPQGEKQTANILTALMSENELQSRLRQMKDTPEGLQLLKNENIVNQDGSWNPARVPTVYEQQLVMNKEIIDRMWMQQTKSFDLEEDQLKLKDFLAKHTDAKLINEANGKATYQFGEQAHKFFFDFEKGTVGGGGGFSLGFLEELTGIKGVGAIMGPNIEKHQDFSSLYRGHMNRIAEHLNSLSGDERAEKIARVQNHFKNERTGELGLTVIDQDGRVTINEHLVQSGITHVDNNEFVNLLESVGLSETVESKYGPTTVVNQAVSMAQVSDYSETVGEGGGKVRFGPRELDMLRRQGLGATANHIAGMIEELATSGEGITNKETAQGILNAGRAIAGDIQPDAATRVWQPDEFRPSPIVDNNRATYARTILDTEWLRGQGPADATGVWVGLPKAEGGKEFTLDGKPADKVFLPYMELEGKGNEVWKTDLQRINERIIRKAQALENTPLATADGQPNTRALNAAQNSLQRELDKFSSQIRTDITSSKGYIGSKVFKGELENSSSGLMKIISPGLTEELGGAFTYISEVDAQKLGVYDTLAAGEDFYVPDLRYPSFHEKASRVTKLQMTPHLGEGQHLISADIADDLRGDSDGDMNHILAVQDDAVQADLAKGYARQWDERVANGHVGAEDQPYSLREISVERGMKEARQLELFDPRDASVAYDEFTAKFGKQLVGQASNLNYRYSHLVMQYGQAAFGERYEELSGALFDFFEGRKGIEQKIISAKHGMDGLVDTSMRNPALDLIEALQQRRWQDASRIDESFLGRMFTKDANMELAMSALEILEEAVPVDQMRDISQRFGLSSGVPESMWVNGEQRLITMGAIMDVVDGDNVNRLATNQSVAMVNQLAGANAPRITTSLPTQEAPAPRVEPPRAYIPGSGRPELSVNNVEIGYTERGASKFGAMLDGFMHSKIGIGVTAAVGLGAGALMLSNLTSADSITPESRPHNDELIQSSHGAGMQGGGTAYVEENGAGLNGLRVNVSGRAPGHLSNGDIGNMANQALSSSGIQGNINVRSQDDTSTIDRQWLEQQFTQLINQGYAGGN